MHRAFTALQLTFITLFTVLVLFTNLGGPRLWDRDEPRNAGCAREMLERHDWVTPVFNGQLRNHKPVFLYWLIMSAYSVFGVSEFAARFWSATLGTATVLVTFALGKRLFGERVGFWSAIVLATSLMFNVAARAATPDSLLIFFCTLGFYFYVRWALPREGEAVDSPGDYFPRSARHAALIYGCFALGVLAKGPVALVLPTAIIGAFLLVAHREKVANHHDSLVRRLLRWPGYFLWTCWRMRPITAIMMVLLLAAPWYLWVGLRTDGKFLWEFFVEHNLHRAQRPMEGHDGPIFYYMLALLPGFFPWSVFLVPVTWHFVVTLRQKSTNAIAGAFCAAWIFVWAGAFSVASTKLPSYVTPTYPALALVTGLFLDSWNRGSTRVPAIWPRLAVGVLAIVGIGLLVALLLVAQRYLPREQWLAMIGVIPLVGAIACTALLYRSRREAALWSLGGAAAAFCLALFAVAAQRVDSYQQNDRLLQIVAQRGDAAELGAFACLEPTWVFYGKRPVRELAADDIPTYLNRGQHCFVITTRRQLEQVHSRLPSDVKVLGEVPYFMKDDQLVLVGHPTSGSLRTARR